ncbi:uncharacterized protein LY79DRAFT_580577 [Colletotrichum navitas]|uniref:C2H2-type domain-containing protein n=1 Tax=Colletotrichum navitas TaxID=681940 RepID=A0AAD8PWV0_9PEZI|nr:uncharacterized protein LY79DRAFT_580577 [Colletotrichum navitas]KAK1586121.1 hypothetical protein LY79DRAFT_580577 [Colletotrichum navitas]
MAPPTAAKRSYAALNRGGANMPIAESWPETPYADFDCSKYDYVPTDDGGFWQLQQQHAPSEQLPNVVPLVATSKSPIQQQQDVEWTCLSAACPSKPFKRKIDLDRHYLQAHADSQTQPSPALSLKDITPATSISNPSPKITTKKNPSGSGKVKGAAGAGVGAGANAGSRNNSVSATGKEKDGAFLCDYPACTRKSEPFSRKDRLRVHLTDVHKEDVDKKTSDMSDSWLQERKIYPKWWRCTKCLDRVKIEESGWECPKDGFKIEERRREFRQKQQPM